MPVKKLTTEQMITEIRETMRDIERGVYDDNGSRQYYEVSEILVMVENGFLNIWNESEGDFDLQQPTNPVGDNV